MGKSDAARNLGVISSKLYELLGGLDSEERIKVMNSVSQLYGDGAHVTLGAASGEYAGPGVTVGGAPALREGSVNAQQYFVQKGPTNKGEMLAVAARYREQHGGGDVYQLNDFAAFFAQARQNFDRSHFVRDMKNAHNQAGLFNKGMPKGQYQLSYFGQQYVDTLPDREALTKLKRPTRRAATKRKQAKKAATK